jgi:hypothetical protein
VFFDGSLRILNKAIIFFILKKIMYLGYCFFTDGAKAVFFSFAVKIITHPHPDENKQ